MRVLVVANGVPDGSKNLDGIFEFDQAKALKGIGADVIFLGIDLRSLRRIRRLGITKGIKEGVKWYKISVPLGQVPLGFFCKIGSWALYYLYKKVLNNNWKPDIIHAHFTEQGYMAVSLAHTYGIPLVLTEHSSQIMKCPINKDIYKIANKAYGGASKIITVSSALSKKISEDFHRETITIPNIIDVDLFSNVLAVEHQSFNVVVVAGLISRKRIDKLIEAISLLRDKIPSVHLHVIGGGPLRSSLETMTRNLHLEERIFFYGSQTREEIAKIFAISDCFALLSAAETFGVVYIEAMAAGLPVVATRCGGPEGFVDSRNGVMVDIDNVPEAANAIEYIYHHKEGYDRDYIRSYAKDNYSPQFVAQKIVHEYDSIINDGSR